MSVQTSSDIVILDEIEACPYLSDKTARMPLRMPVIQISPQEVDVRLAQGHRRTGEFLYQTRCPDCKACEPIRIDCEEFEIRRSQRRVLRRGDREIEVKLGPVMADSRRVDLFNKHRQTRGLAKIDSSIDIEEYIWGFVRSCFNSFEISYWIDGQLAGAAICDQGQDSLSAVYTFYDPDFGRYCIGTFSILKQIEYCLTQGLKYLYLGYYIGPSPHMKYKERFRPNERRINGEWIKFNSET
ncbi:MAG: arginyltransferase [Planctomycetota bacterium]|nr:arginyltransferase [Planctomycetota bacterium]